MHRTSFWILVDLITPVWPAEPKTKKTHRPIYQQIAVALYVLFPNALHYDIFIVSKNLLLYILMQCRLFATQTLLVLFYPTNHSLYIFFDPVSNASSFLPFRGYCTILGGVVISRYRGVGGVVMS
ncbi:hypothetical protein BGX38DRAFT_1240716, partial [Terfezia claveryi]